MTEQSGPADPTPTHTPRQDYVYGRPPGAGDWRRTTRLVLLGLLVVFSVLFFVRNNHSVEVSLVVTSVTIPLIWVLLGTFAAGALFMYLALHLRRRAVRKAQQ